MKQASTLHGLTVCGAVALCMLMIGTTGCETTNPELRHRGNAAYLSGNYERSRDFYAQAVRQRPTDIEAQYGLGRAHLAMGQPRDALLAFEEAHSMASEMPRLRPEILDGIAEGLYQLDRHDRLHEFLRRSVERYGTTRDHLRQGRYLARMGDMDAAEGAFRRAAYFAQEGDAEPFLALATFYENINNIPKAVESLRNAYWAQPDNPVVSQRLRDHGLVPGPTVALEPDRAMLRR